MAVVLDFKRTRDERGQHTGFAVAIGTFVLGKGRTKEETLDHAEARLHKWLADIGTIRGR